MISIEDSCSAKCILCIKKLKKFSYFCQLGFKGNNLIIFSIIPAQTLKPTLNCLSQNLKPGLAYLPVPTISCPKMIKNTSDRTTAALGDMGLHSVVLKALNWYNFV